MMAFKISKNRHMKPNNKGSFNSFNSLKTKGKGLDEEHYEKFKDNLKDVNKLDANIQPAFIKTKKLKPKQYISFA
jgi:hypothetical protein